MTSLAPGKLILTGEYAVLRGHSAVTVSVNRYVRSEIKQKTIQKSYFLQEVVAAMALEFGSRDKSVDVARAVACDSRLFKEGDQKLGLGSSAAVTVSAIHAVLTSSEKSTELPLVHRLAHKAHRDAQKRLGASGSGVDVTTATFGGVLQVKGSGDDTPCVFNRSSWPKDLYVSFLFLNQSASTPHFVKSFIEAGDKTKESIVAIGKASAAFYAAIKDQNPLLAIQAFKNSFEALKLLENSAAMKIIPPKVHVLAQKASELGGAFKTTGAGGGDVAIGLFDSAANLKRFNLEAEVAGLQLLPLELENLGVHQEQ